MIELTQVEKRGPVWIDPDAVTSVSPGVVGGTCTEVRIGGDNTTWYVEEPPIVVAGLVEKNRSGLAEVRQTLMDLMRYLTERDEGVKKRARAFVKEVEKQRSRDRG